MPRLDATSATYVVVCGLGRIASLHGIQIDESEAWNLQLDRL